MSGNTRRGNEINILLNANNGLDAGEASSVPYAKPRASAQIHKDSVDCFVLGMIPKTCYSTWLGELVNLTPAELMSIEKICCALKTVIRMHVMRVQSKNWKPKHATHYDSTWLQADVWLIHTVDKKPVTFRIMTACNSVTHNESSHEKGSIHEAHV